MVDHVGVGGSGRRPHRHDLAAADLGLVELGAAWRDERDGLADGAAPGDHRRVVLAPGPGRARPDPLDLQASQDYPVTARAPLERPRVGNLERTHWPTPGCAHRPGAAVGHERDWGGIRAGRLVVAATRESTTLAARPARAASHQHHGYDERDDSQPKQARHGHPHKVAGSIMAPPPPAE